LQLIDWSTVDATNEEDVATAIDKVVLAHPSLKKAETPNQTQSSDDEEEDGESTESGTPVQPANKKKPLAAQPNSVNNKKPKVFKRSELRKMTADQINNLYETGGLKEAMEAGQIVND